MSLMKAIMYDRNTCNLSFLNNADHLKYILDKCNLGFFPFTNLKKDIDYE